MFYSYLILIYNFHEDQSHHQNKLILELLKTQKNQSSKSTRNKKVKNSVEADINNLVILEKEEIEVLQIKTINSFIHSYNFYSFN